MKFSLEYNPGEVAGMDRVFRIKVLTDERNFRPTDERRLTDSKPGCISGMNEINVRWIG